MEEFDLIQNSTLKKTCDQSDFENRLKFNIIFEAAYCFDN